MHVFVIGATGWIGSAITGALLLSHHHARTARVSGSRPLGCQSPSRSGFRSFTSEQQSGEFVMLLLYEVMLL